MRTMARVTPLLPRSFGRRMRRTRVREGVKSQYLTVTFSLSLVSFERLDCISLAPARSTVTAIETHSLPALVRCYPCSFTFYVADPTAPFPIAVPGFLGALAAVGTSRRKVNSHQRLTALPAMSLIPLAPFPSMSSAPANSIANDLKK
jgi:hypothetical protein